MRTSRTHRHSTIDTTTTPSYKKVTKLFSSFAEEEIIQSPTLNKYEYNDNAIDGIVEFFETVFENKYGKVTIRFYLSDEEGGTRRSRYSAIFESDESTAEYAVLGIMLMPNTKDGDTVRLYDGHKYYYMPDGYLLATETLNGMEKFVRGIPYYGEEEFGGKEFMLS